MVPTAILGLVMGYVLFETENIFYCMLIHFTNNAFSVILTNALVWLERLQGTGAQAVDVATDRLPLASVGIYMTFATIAPLLLYIGNYLIHRGQPDIRRYSHGRKEERCGECLVPAQFFLDVESF